MKKRLLPCSIYRAVVFLFCAVSLCTGIKSEAQQTPRVRDWKRQPLELHVKKQSLPDIITLITEKAGCSIMVDGQPLKTAIDLEFTGTVAQVLDRVARAFDYDWKVSRSGILLLTKRFDNPDERPQMQIKELHRTAVDIFSLLSSVPIADRQLSECFGLLAVTFSPEQYAALREGTALRIGDMLPEQQALAMKAIYTHLLRGSLQVWKELVAQLSDTRTAYLSLEETEVWLDLKGTQKKRGFGFFFHSNPPVGGKQSVPLITLEEKPVTKPGGTKRHD